MKYFRNYFIFIASLLLAVPAYSFADFNDTVILLGKVRAIEISASSLISKNQALRDAIDSLYQKIIESLQAELANLQALRITSVSFSPLSSPLMKGSLASITFQRSPSDSSSPVDFFVEVENGRAVGILASGVSTNSFNWQVADNFVVGKNYVILAKNIQGKLLGKSDLFTTITPVTPVLPVSAVISAVDIASADVNNGSIGFWSFDRSSNNCETRGGAITNADGRIGSALGLNGTDAYCKVANNRIFYPKNFTLALWAKSAPSFVSGWNESNWFISLRDRSGFNIGPVKGTKNVQFTILDDTNLNQVPYIVATVAPDNITDWHHYAMTYNGDTANVYLDGVIVNSTTTTIARSNAGDRDLNFGFDDVTGQPKGAGTLDEIRLYNRPLTTCEIQLLAGKGCGNISGFGPWYSHVNIASIFTAIQ